MARREANLAGLAALGMLGYKLAQGKEAKTTTGGTRATMPTGDDQYDENVKQYMDDTYNPDVKQYMDDTVNPDVKQRKPAAKTASSPSAPKSAGMSREDEAKIRETGGSRGTRYLPKSEAQSGPDMSAYKPRRTPDQIGPMRTVEGRRPMTREQSIAAIPTDEGKYAPVSGSKIDSTELGRNASNIMNATAGLSVPGYVGKMTQAGYNARAAARRGAEGLSDAEVADLMRRRALSEADTTGGAVGYKKGGAAKVKKMASGGMAKEKKPAAKGWGKARGARGAKYY